MSSPRRIHEKQILTLNLKPVLMLEDDNIKVNSSETICYVEDWIQGTRIRPFGELL
jgi:hypothetical protein